ncbi:MAG: ADOP family duplicated permease [Gemmatimonadaceae bacterium]
MQMATQGFAVLAAVRRLRQRPAFAATVVLTLTLAIGTATATFGAVQRVLLRALPVRDGDRLVVMRALDHSRTDPHVGVPNGLLWDYAAASHAVSEIGGFAPTAGASPVPVGDGDRTLQMTLSPVTANFFHVLGVIPTLGRILDTSDAHNPQPVAMLSFEAWQQQFGGRPDIIGHQIEFFSRSYSIVGVVPEGFDISKGTDLWLADEQLSYLWGMSPSPQLGYWDMVARLRPGVTLAAARADLTAFLRRYDWPSFGESRTRGAEVEPLLNVVVGDMRTALLILSVAVVLVLAIACANVATLMLTNGLARQGELATRAALGADRTQLVKLMAGESAVLGVVGCILGVGLAALLLHLVRWVAPPGLPRFDGLQITGPALWFAVAVTLGSVLVFGLAPALLVTGPSLDNALRRSSRSVSKRMRSRRLLVLLQVSFAVVVLAESSLVRSTLLRLERVKLGFDSNNLMYLTVQRLAPVSATASSMAAAEQRFDHLMSALPDALQGKDGILGATSSDLIPFQVVGGTFGLDDHYNLEGQALRDNVKSPTIGFDVAADTYFQVMKIPLERGRSFGPVDDATSTRVAIVSEAMARQAWPGQDALGKRIRLGNDAGQGPWRTVVGIVGDVRYRDIRSVRPTVYIPVRQADPGVVLVVRTSDDPRHVVPVVNQALRQLDDGYRIGRAISIGQVLDLTLARPRFLGRALEFLAGTALVIAVIGIFGVLANLVRERRHEIGIRGALGAPETRLALLIVREALLLVGLGTTVGIAASVLVARGLRSVLFGVAPGDPRSLALAVAVMLLSAGIASYLPTMRAAHVDPMEVLHSQ